MKGKEMAAEARKKNNPQSVLQALFKECGLSTSRPEFGEFLAEAEKVASTQFGSDTLIQKAFKERVETLFEKVKEEEEASEEQRKAQEKAERIASERSLAPVRLNNSRMLMALPFFSPDQKLRKQYFEYTSPDGRITLEVHPSPKVGAAKVWDGDILMFALSKAVDAWLRSSEKPSCRAFPKVVEFTAYEYLKQAGKDPHSGKNLSDVKDKLERLGLTRYKCNLINLSTNKPEHEKTFGLCDCEWTNEKDGSISKIIMTFTEELFRYFASRNDLLTLKKELLLEAWKEDRSGLRKRLLMLVGVHLGEQKSWKVSLKTLQGMCGHITELKYFKRELSRLSAKLPWEVEIERNKEGEDIVYFVPKPEGETGV